MKKTMFLFTCLLCFSTLQAQELKTQNDSLSYAVGVLWGQNIKQQGLSDINATIIGQAIGDVLSDTKADKLDIKAANEIVKHYFEKQKELQKAKNTEAGRVYLADNAKRKGVVVMPSGLQYEVLKEGAGPSPGPNDVVTVHYQGTLIDGTIFDSSIQRGEPATFPVNGVIQGWVEALQLMKTGSKWKLFIPYNLAYGERGAGQQIGPYATLIFEVELLKIGEDK